MEQLISPSEIEINRTVYDDFERCMTTAGIMRLLRATHVISELRERKKLLQYSAGHVSPEAISTESEDSTAWEKITILAQKFDTGADDAEALAKEYLAATYLRCIRLVTDFLENDKSIAVDTPEQNLNRALNRLILLEELENFLKGKYAFDIHA